MRKIVLYTLLAGSLCMSSCSADFLERTDPTKQTDYWTSLSEAESSLAAVYSPIKFQMYGYFGAFDGWLNMNSRADDIYTIRNEESGMWAIATYQNSTSTGNDPYSHLYTGIQRANVFLKYVDNVPVTSDADRNEIAMMKAEAQTLRAYQYYLLIINYGGAIPLRTVPSNEDDANKAPSTSEAIWAQIESDLLAVVGSDPAKWTNAGGTVDDPLPINQESSNKGRIEKGAALAFLAKVYAAQHKYEDAKTVLDVLCRNSTYYGGRYGLMPDFKDNFTPDNENNMESVFELQYSSSGTGSWGNESGINLGSTLPQFLGPAKTGGWAKLMPSAYALYEFAKELRPEGSDSKFDKRLYTSMFFNPEEYDDNIVSDTGEKRKDAKGEILEDKWGEEIPVYKSNVSWYDNQVYGDYFYFDQLWDGNEAKMAGGYPDFTRVIHKLDEINGTNILATFGVTYDGESEIQSTSGKSNSERIRFLLKKYTAWWNGTDSPDGMGNSLGCSNNVRVIRFSEILLLYAEACMKTGDDTDAQWAINEVRKRAGLGEMTKTGQELWDEMEHQCLLEFFGEGHRFYDLKRWYVELDGADTGWEKVQKILEGHYREGLEQMGMDWDSGDSGAEINTNKNFAEDFQRKHLYYPIPTGELNNNSAMSQSDVWK